ncbi:MAG: cell envelope integrity protein TolA [Polaromonas sp.]|nr:MAG: cell envelope integrity protein TolA [Polaromonas sp.]
MPSTADRIEFAPPTAKGSIRAFSLALLVHALLIAALAWGVNWKRSDTSVSYEAELWSALPRQVAPRLTETLPEPTPEVSKPAPVPAPPPPALEKPAVKAPPPPPLPAPNVDIALEQEKKRKQLALQKEAEVKKEAAKALEKDKAIALAKKQKERRAEEEQARRLAQAEAAKQEAREAAKEAQKLQAQKAAQQLARQQAQSKQAEAASQKQREENLARLKGMAGASGTTNDTGTALKSSGPSASYGGALRAAIRPNVVFTEEIVGNPMATVEVRVAPDGTIISQRLVKSSGNKNWDDAAVNAIIRTRVMPKDVDGRMPDTILLIDMRARG